MAHGLAIIHWKAQLDGYGIIFVLGGRPLLTMPSPETAMTWQQFASRSDRNAFLNSCVWIHHFEGCCEISFTMLGVEAIVHAMISSHPAYPRPNEAGMKLWTVFETRYLEVSAAVLEGQEDAVKVLPKKVMDVFKENQEFIDSDSDYSLSS